MASIDNRSPILVPTPTVDEQAANKAYVDDAVSGGGGDYALNADVVHDTGDETVAGIKTFSSAPVVPVGAAAGNPVRRDDARLTDARTPVAHNHAGSDINSGTVPYARLPVGTAASTVAAGDDSRLSDARTPTAHVHSGADINSGTVPYARLPVGTAGSTVAAGDDSRFTSAVAYSRLPVGTAASTVAAGNDSRLSDARTPTAHVHSGADITSGTVPYARLPVGTAASTVAAGDDSRLTNARTPTAHAASHEPDGSDPLRILVSSGNIGATTWTPNLNTGNFYRCNATASTITLGVPSNGFDTADLQCEVTATAATSLAINGSILLTTGITTPIAIPINKKAFLGLRCIGTTWYLVAATVQS